MPSLSEGPSEPAWHRFYDVRIPVSSGKLGSEEQSATKHFLRSICNRLKRSGFHYTFDRDGFLHEGQTGQLGITCDGLSPAQAYDVIRSELSSLELQPHPPFFEKPATSELTKSAVLPRQMTATQSQLSKVLQWFRREPQERHKKAVRHIATTVDNTQLAGQFQKLQEWIDGHHLLGNILPAIVRWHLNKRENESLNRCDEISIPYRATLEVCMNGQRIRIRTPDEQVSVMSLRLAAAEIQLFLTKQDKPIEGGSLHPAMSGIRFQFEPTGFVITTSEAGVLECVPSLAVGCTVQWSRPPLSDGRTSL